jgi:hypothetical protein
MPLALLSKQFGISGQLFSDHVDEPGSEERPASQDQFRGERYVLARPYQEIFSQSLQLRTNVFGTAQA